MDTRPFLTSLADPPVSTVFHKQGALHQNLLFCWNSSWYRHATLSDPPTMPVTLLGQLRDKQPGTWSSSSAKGSHLALPLGVISPAGMAPAAAPGPGQGQGQASSEQPIPIPTSAPLGLSASWFRPRSGQMVQGAGGRKLRGGALGWSWARTRFPQLRSAQRLDTCRAPRSGRLAPPHPTHSRSSFGLTRPSTAGTSGFLFVAHPHPLRYVISFCSGWEV